MSPKSSLRGELSDDQGEPKLHTVPQMLLAWGLLSEPEGTKSADDTQKDTHGGHKMLKVGPTSAHLPGEQATKGNPKCKKCTKCTKYFETRA
jgi:hypothetical protein